jgi:cell division protease FtsH
MKQLIAIDKTNYNKNNNNDNDDNLKNVKTKHYTKMNELITKKLIDKSMEKNIKLTFTEKTFMDNPIQNSVHFCYDFGLPILLIGIFGKVLSTFVSKITFDQFEQNTGSLQIYQNHENITLSSWKGSPEIFNEFTEVISFLQDGQIYKNMGALVPKGILLEGQPGTGKTMLAKAIASQINATFLSVPASEFVELFVGKGALRVRQLFEIARQNRPAIIFIDEIDSIGKQRYSNSLGMNEERENTLNQLLTEMDGFNNNYGILVIGATNRKDVLDDALLRPGRFDRIIHVPLPDMSSRISILKSYLDKTIYNQNISISNLASMTNGFSGADLKNLVNEAIIHTVRRGKRIVHMTDINNALDKIVVGVIKQNDDRTFDVKKRVALHEIGHAFIASSFKEYFNLHKVSIQNTYNGAGGYTLFTENSSILNGGLYTKDFLIKHLMVILGGKACEELFYGTLYMSVGASEDLKNANEIAKNMVEKYGMGNKYFAYSKLDNNMVSDNTQYNLDKEIYSLIVQSYTHSLHILEKNKEKIDDISNKLIHDKYINGDEFYKYIL